MTNEEAKAIIRKEYLCVDRDCDIERNCGRCDLMMPSKEPILEAFKMAMDALDRNATTKDCLGVDAISRQAVLDKMRERDEEVSCLTTKDIKELPSVNPTKTGHWIRHDNKIDAYYYECSECGNISYMDEANYCYECGADMRGDAE